MRKIVSMLVLGFIAMGTIQAQAPTAEKVVGSYIKAIGGAAKWKAVKTMKLTVTMRTQGIDLPGEVNATAQGKQRMEFTYSGISMVQAYDGTTAWTIDGFSGKTEPAKLEGAQAESLSDEEFLDEFIDYKEKGSTIAYLGEEEYQGLPYHKLSMKKKDGGEAEYLFDQETSLLMVKRESEGGQVVETLFQDYKKDNGLTMAMKVVGMSGGQVLQSFIVNKVELNTEMSDDMFAYPGK